MIRHFLEYVLKILIEQNKLMEGQFSLIALCRKSNVKVLFIPFS